LNPFKGLISLKSPQVLISKERFSKLKIASNSMCVSILQLSNVSQKKNHVEIALENNWETRFWSLELHSKPVEDKRKLTLYNYTTTGSLVNINFETFKLTFAFNKSIPQRAQDLRKGTNMVC